MQVFFWCCCSGKIAHGLRNHLSFFHSDVVHKDSVGAALSGNIKAEMVSTIGRSGLVGGFAGEDSTLNQFAEEFGGLCIYGGGGAHIHVQLLVVAG